MSEPLSFADWNARNCAIPDGPEPIIATRLVIFFPIGLSLDV